MFSAKQLADFGYKTFSFSMLLLTMTTISIFGYQTYQTTVQLSELRKHPQSQQEDQPASP